MSIEIDLRGWNTDQVKLVVLSNVHVLCLLEVCNGVTLLCIIKVIIEGSEGVVAMIGEHLHAFSIL